MSYLVLARKWRPQFFREVAAQSHVTITLQNAIKANRVPHAMVFCGPRGVGKTTVARILAKALNCEKGPAPEPCNQCPSCREIAQGTSMDVYEMDGASNRGIDEIREIRENVRYLPSSSRYKVYIIDEVHMLTKEAFNALLKTLEEPPPHVIFIFATTEPHKIPSTIMSRCQCYPFRRISNQILHQRLKEVITQEKIKIDQEALWIIVRAADGSLRDALSLLDQVVSFSAPPIQGEHVRAILGLFDTQLILQALEAILKTDINRVMEIVSHICEQGEDLKEFYRQLVMYWRHLLMIKINPQTSLVDLPEHERAQLATLAQIYPLTHLEQLFDILLAEEQILRNSTQPRFVLEALLIKLTEFANIVPIDVIIKKLSHVELKTKRSKESERPEEESERESLIQEDKIFKKAFLKSLKRECPILVPVLENAPVIRNDTTITLKMSKTKAKLLEDKQLWQILKNCLGKEGEIIIDTNHKFKENHPKIDTIEENKKGLDFLKQVLKIFGGEVVTPSRRKQ
ncbi:MAG TPA: DNA polymerase III subunit gamma/tau [Candidatus Desulfofervidus auxilii]|uniref:DNA polymerase III subunit gamma/tau n=1 Tax=Desulfofervidus auxilii TaxID=1621989 RepID=A0A7C1VUX0_DESA2|nr:DNA polymerase III subunit gamma/tau [Candidatus Desulfofervidus auxilii]